MSIRFRIASLIFGMINAVVFGAGAILVLSVPDLSAQAMTLLPVVVALSFLISAPAAWFLAPRLRLRFWRARETQRAGGATSATWQN